ncbi:MAG: hypothetical protein ABI234_01825 [Ktedonobacteraceae bacterium]
MSRLTKNAARVLAALPLPEKRSVLAAQSVFTANDEKKRKNLQRLLGAASQDCNEENILSLFWAEDAYHP